MEKSTQNHRLHLSEGVRTALITIGLFGLIALITFLEFSGKLN